MGEHHHWAALTPSTMWGHSEKVVISEPGSWLSLDTKSTSILILDFPAPRTVKKKFLLFLRPIPVYGLFVTAAQVTDNLGTASVQS